MGFPLNHKKLNFSQGSRKPPSFDPTPTKGQPQHATYTWHACGVGSRAAAPAPWGGARSEDGGLRGQARCGLEKNGIILLRAVGFLRDTKQEKSNCGVQFPSLATRAQTHTRWRGEWRGGQGEESISTPNSVRFPILFSFSSRPMHSPRDFANSLRILISE